MIAVVDYGVGNLFSLSRSLEFLGLPCAVTADKAELARADRVILPGVGAFGDAAAKLRASGLDAALKSLAASGVPLLGICLGMQLLFERSFEYGEHAGLGLIPGEICPMREDLPAHLKTPQIGWNALRFLKGDPILKYSREGDYVFYVHSYYAKNCGASLVAYSEYGVRVPGVVAAGNVRGCQFHPEKSGDAGLAMLKAFSEI